MLFTLIAQLSAIGYDYAQASYVFDERIMSQQVGRFEENLVSAPLVIMDGNIPAETIRYICDVCHANQVPGMSAYQMTLLLLMSAHQMTLLLSIFTGRCSIVI